MFALCVVLATLVVQSASAVSILPTYGAREVLFNTGGPQPQEAATADFNCDGRMDVVRLQGAFRTAARPPEGGLCESRCEASRKTMDRGGAGDE